VTSARRAALLATLLTSAAVAWAPLVHGPGYEHALVLGILLPAPFAVVGARLGRGARAARALLAALVRGLAAIAVGAMTPWLRYGACAPLADAAYELVTLGLGLASSMVWGMHAARIAGGRFGVVLAAAGPLGSLAASVAVFYATPTVHAFDAFAGYFSGPVYDTVLRLDGPFVAHRVAVGAWCLLAWAAAAWGKPARASSAAVCALLVAVGALGPQLGTWLTRGDLASRLPRTVERGGCILHASGALEPSHVERLARDAADRRRAIEAAFGVALPGPIHVFVFRDGAEKARLVGAADTLVAKPWRGEVLVQGTAYPHPVLGHEIAHVVAGAFAHGPLRVPGRFGGLVANPGLVEGVAVAAAPSEEALTERAWASAMRARGLLPPLAELFGLAFLGGNASRGYTAAGAFVAFVIERHGVASLRRWYGGEPLESVLGAPMAQVERSFHAWLDEEPTSEAERRVAEARFGAPGIAGRRCPHLVDEALERAGRCQREGRVEEARGALARVTALEPRSGAARLLEASLASPDAILGAHAAIAADETLPATARDEALARAGDLAWLAGRGEEAAARYDEALARTADDARSRLLEVKRAFARDPSTPDAVRASLTAAIRGARPEVDPLVLGVALARWRSPIEGPVHLAFRAQQLLLRDACADGAPLARAVPLDEAPAPLARAMVRGLAVCACLADDHAEVRSLAAIAASKGAWPRGFRRTIADLAARCAPGIDDGTKKVLDDAPAP
jgi:hypothetical protein